MSDLAHLDHFFVRQRITMMVNRYEIRAAAPDGAEGPLVAIAQQKRMAFKEQVTFYADEATQARGLLASRPGTGSTSAPPTTSRRRREPIGWFRKDFGRSLLRSTWHMGTPDGCQATGTERSAGVAIARRRVGVMPVVENLPSPFLFHFDFIDGAGQRAMSSARSARCATGTT